MMQNKPKMKQGTWLLSMPLFPHVSHQDIQTSLCVLAPRDFPTLKIPHCNVPGLEILQKGFTALFLKLGPIHSHLQYNTHNQPDKPQKQWSSMKKSDVLPSAQCAPRTVLSRGHPPPSGRKASWNRASRCQTRNKARRVHAPPSNTPSS